MRTGYAGRTTEPLTPEKHAIVDDVFLASDLAVPSLLGASTRTRALFAGFGLVQGTLDALTDQPLALRRVVPSRVHGLVEKGSAPLFAVLPLVVRVQHDRRGRLFWAASAVALVTAHHLTDWDASDTDR